ncbi:immunoglobulin-like domain-containing protein [Carnobacterium sp. FSL E2-0243]|uniref:immunoglobulin-like domain-containing protein n=1 Tax=Carnobacterium sp. FSL E2-0243 TaxID=2921365 RepID=UPI0030FA5AE8
MSEENNENPKEQISKKNKWFVGISTVILLGLGVGSYNYLMAPNTNTTKSDTKKNDTNNSRLKKDSSNSTTKSKNSDKKTKDEKKAAEDQSIVDIFSNVKEPLSKNVPTTKTTTNQLLNLLALAAEDNKDTVTAVEKPTTIKPGDNTNPIVPPVIKPPVFQAPIITNNPTILVELGGSFDPYQFASVSDLYDSNIELIVDVSKLDLSTSGTYPIYYSTGTNSKGLTAEPKVSYVTVNSRPILTTLTDEVTIPVRSNFNPSEFVTAFDLEDGDLSNSIWNDSNVSTDYEGNYVVTYYVQDKHGFSATPVSINVSVTNEAPIIISPTINVQIDTEIDLLQGVRAFDKESGNITNDVKILSSNVNFSKEGQYEVVLFVDDGNGKTATRTRTVNVTNEAPVIHAEDKNYHVLDHTSFTIEMALEGVSVTDKEDGSILVTEDMINKEQFAAIQSNVPGSYPLTYSVSDKHGKTTEKTIIVTYLNDNPIINGASDSTIHVGTVFDPLENVDVTDREEGILTDRLIVDDLDGFNSEISGEYRFKYSVQDSFGGSSEVIRTITVVNDSPTISGVEDVTIEVGDSFDEMEGVIFNDTETPIELLHVEILGEVNIDQVGVFQLTYIVTDGHGKTIEQVRIVTVVEKEAPLIELESK